ncbi:MAG: hypothetical protein JRF17_09400 [Deltaproteobacteria bacterium]|jgi:hypothetical protein|nr:hypothetical protein [Deltaproteobacteria bacterium]MBW2492281.1 hypothetical protein [Deltaproteobacteria bacterium]
MGIAVITDNMPKHITLFSIESKQLYTGLDLSTEVAPNLSRLLDIMAAELKEIGFKIQPKN